MLVLFSEYPGCKHKRIVLVLSVLDNRVPTCIVQCYNRVKHNTWPHDKGFVMKTYRKQWPLLNSYLLIIIIPNHPIINPFSKTYFMIKFCSKAFLESSRENKFFYHIIFIRVYCVHSIFFLCFIKHNLDKKCESQRNGGKENFQSRYDEYHPIYKLKWFSIFPSICFMEPKLNVAPLVLLNFLLNVNQGNWEHELLRIFSGSFF